MLCRSTGQNRLILVVVVVAAVVLVVNVDVDVVVVIVVVAIVAVVSGRRESLRTERTPSKEEQKLWKGEVRRNDFVITFQECNAHITLLLVRFLFVNCTIF